MSDSQTCRLFQAVLDDDVDSVIENITDDILTLIAPIFPYSHILNFAAYHNSAGVIEFLKDNVPELMHIDTQLKPAHYAAMSGSVHVLRLLPLDPTTPHNLTLSIITIFSSKNSNMLSINSQTFIILC